MPQRVVILGAGFAGTAVARALERRARPGEVSVTLANRENYTLFTPMLPEVSSGAIEPRHIAPPLRALLHKSQFEMGEVESVDLEQCAVVVRNKKAARSSRLPYDHLVIALGAITSTHGVPGADSHTFPLKTMDDAIAQRNETIRSLEAAATLDDDRERRAFLTFVVVGGGFTGVEAAGELLGFLRSAARFYPRVERDDVRVVLVAGGPRLLPQLPQSLGDGAAKMLAQRGVEVVLNDDAAAVDGGGVTLASGRRYESKTIIWSAGVATPPLVAHLDVEHSKHHAIVVNPDLSVPNRSGVWAVGDCAQIPKPGGDFYPQTAQHALREAPVLARNLLATLRGRPTKPFAYKTLGMMASIGGREGLADIRNRFTLTGLPAWLLWRAYYLSRLPGRFRKTRVALDWALTLPFPQDIASVG